MIRLNIMDWEPTEEIQHWRVREAIKDLIDELYSEGPVNKEFLVEQLGTLCDQYEVYFDENEPLKIDRNEKVITPLFDWMADTTHTHNKLVSRG